MSSGGAAKTPEDEHDERLEIEFTRATTKPKKDSEATKRGRLAHKSLATMLSAAITAPHMRQASRAVVEQVLKALPHVMDLKKNLGMLLRKRGDVPVNCFLKIKEFATGIWPQLGPSYVLNQVETTRSQHDAAHGAMAQDEGNKFKFYKDVLNLFHVHGLALNRNHPKFRCPDGKMRRLTACAMKGHVRCLRTAFLHRRRAFADWGVIGELYARAIFGGHKRAIQFVRRKIEERGRVLLRVSQGNLLAQCAVKKTSAATQSQKGEDGSPQKKRVRLPAKRATATAEAAFLGKPQTGEQLVTLRLGYDAATIGRWCDYNPAALSDGLNLAVDYPCGFVQKHVDRKRAKKFHGQFCTGGDAANDTEDSSDESSEY